MDIVTASSGLIPKNPAVSINSATENWRFLSSLYEHQPDLAQDISTYDSHGNVLMRQTISPADSTPRALRDGLAIAVAGLVAFFGWHILDRYRTTMYARRNQEFSMVVLLCSALICLIPFCVILFLTTCTYAYWYLARTSSSGAAWVDWSWLSRGGLRAATLALLILVAMYSQRIVLDFFGRRGAFVPADQHMNTPSRCKHCNYNTEGLSFCPECGHGQPGAPLSAYSERRIHGTVSAMLVGVAAIGSFMPLIVGSLRGLWLLIQQ